MNLDLLSQSTLYRPYSLRETDTEALTPADPFSTAVPENFDSSVDAAALCARFNPRGLYAGHYLAVGRLDGVVAVLDFETKDIVRWLEGHVKAVTSVRSVLPAHATHFLFRSASPAVRLLDV